MQQVVVKKLKKEPGTDPSTTSVAYGRMSDSINLVSHLLGGTPVMREAGEDFLPRHAMESDASYERRLETAVLANYFGITLEALVGLPFSQGVALQDDVPKTIIDQSEDIDLQGNHLNVFARRWFRSGLAKGVAWALIEHPPKKEIEGRARTLADDIQEGMRPFWVLIQPENVLMVRMERIGGIQKVTHFRFRETVLKQTGFVEEEVNRIHVREPGRFEVFEETVDRGKVIWKSIERGDISLQGEVPVVPFYAGEPSAVAEIKPPLLDLAYLNVLHWQSYSDQNNILSVCRFPMLAASGVETVDDTIEVGPNTVLATESPDAKYYFVEHTGQAVEAGRKSLVDLEDKMAQWGADWLSRGPDYQSATGKVIDHTQKLSQLQSIIMLFQDAMERALKFHAMWIKEKQGGSVLMRSDMGPRGYESAELMLLFTLYRAGLISAERMIAELQRRNAIDPDLVPQTETDEGRKQLLDRIEKELEPQFIKKDNGSLGNKKEASGASKRQERRFVGKPAGNDPLKG
jgi:hypothetical protein